MTGESVAIKKNEENPFLISGTNVTEGTAEMLVTAVGLNSAWGMLYKDLQKDPEVYF